MTRRRAFTLVDLTIALAIPLMLLALCLPAISRAREEANAAKCQANLKAIYAGLVVYARQNNDLMPKSGKFHMPGWDAESGKAHPPNGNAYLSWCEALVIDGAVRMDTNRNGMLNPNAGRHYPACGFGIFLCPSHGRAPRSDISKGRIYFGYGLAWCAVSEFQAIDHPRDMKPRLPVKAKTLVPDHIIVADGHNQMADYGQSPQPNKSQNGVHERHLRGNKKGAHYLMAGGQIEWSDVYGGVPSPRRYGEDATKCQPPVWVHPQAK